MTEQTPNGMKCKADFQFLLEQTEQNFLHHLCTHCTGAGNIWQQWHKPNWIWSLYNKHAAGHMNPEKLPTHTSINRALMQNSNPARTWNSTDLSNAARPALLERNALWWGFPPSHQVTLPVRPSAGLEAKGAQRAFSTQALLCIYKCVGNKAHTDWKQPQFKF